MRGTVQKSMSPFRPTRDDSLRANDEGLKSKAAGYGQCDHRFTGAGIATILGIPVSNHARDQFIAMLLLPIE
jgi:hypothetical protein